MTTKCEDCNIELEDNISPNMKSICLDCHDNAFENDKEKSIDFKNLTKEEFLKSYSYLTEEEYDKEVNK